jgi:hypothetical protein
MLDPEESNALMRKLFGCLAYRLGGEVTFTQEEINTINTEVAGVTIFLTPENSIVLRVRGPVQTAQGIEEGKIVPI